MKSWFCWEWSYKIPQENKVDSRTGSLIAGVAQSASPDVASPQDDDDGAHDVEASTNLHMSDKESTADTSIAPEDDDGVVEAGPSQLIAKDATSSAVNQKGKQTASGPVFVDVAAQTLAEEHDSQIHQLGTQYPAMPGPSVDTKTTHDLPDKSSEHRQGPPGK